MKNFKRAVLPFFVLVFFCSSCTVPTYVQSTPNIPLLEQKKDLDITLIPPVGFNTPELLPRAEILANYAFLDFLFLQGSLLLAPSADKTQALDWNNYKFRNSDFSLGFGYFKVIEEHNFSVSLGYGIGQLNNAKIWEWPTNSENLRASFAQYDRLYFQGGYSIQLSERVYVGIGLRYEVNDYKNLKLMNAQFDKTTNIRESFELKEWNNEKLRVLSPLFSFTHRSKKIPLGSFLKMGTSNMQNWNDIHANKFYITFGLNLFLKRDQI